MEVRPAELANLYALLSRGGEYRELVWTLDQDPGPTHHLLSPGASWLTRQALRRRDRPDFPGRRQATGLPAEVFWKTGTSARRRDAWAAGGACGLAAAVWVGNFDGSGVNSLSGSERAGPILFDVLEGLCGRRRPGEDERPGDLIEVKLCEWSGWLAGPHCPSTRTGWALRASVPTVTCPYHAEFLLDRQSGLRLNSLCAAGREVERRRFLVLPSSLRRWIKDLRLDSADPPDFDPGCAPTTAGVGPRISYPRPDAVFLLIPGLKPEDQEIKLEAEAGREAGALSWFVDGRFLATAPAAERLWLLPTPGEHEVRVMDASGRCHSVRITILPPG
jgi:penicillin-binding protein 1C